MPTQLTALSVTKSYDGRTVLDAVSCAVSPGERVGVVGENGSGKSTLLRLLAGRETPDEGEVVRTADGGIGHFTQDGALPPRLTVRQVVDEALGELRAVERRLRELEAALESAGAEPDAASAAALREYGELLTLFELRGGYEADARVERALRGLGLGGLDQDRLVGTLSGGERTRLRLAAVLAAGPEVLLLDEPTNHLDDEALGWLEDHLRERPGTTVAVSHDRDFLERVATTLVEVDGDRHRTVRHGDGYAGYLAAKAAARRRWAQAYERWREEVDRTREALATTARRVAPGRAIKDGNKMAYDRAGGRVQQSVAGRVRRAEERLRRLLADPVPPPPEPLRFPAGAWRAATAADRPEEAGPPGGARGPAAAGPGAAVARSATGGTPAGARPGGGPARAATAPAASRPGAAPPEGARPAPVPESTTAAPASGTGPRVLLRAGSVSVTGRLAPVGLAVAVGERLLVTGPNGAGKSTLLRVLAGELPPGTGRVERHGRTALLPQDPAPGRADLTLLESFAHGLPGPAEDHAELLLSYGLFPAGLLSVPAGRLSTGQRQRLALARLLGRPADVLLLDEPTNHLSPALTEELEAALGAFDGALVVVSHDRRLRRRWTGGRLELTAPDPAAG